MRRDIPQNDHPENISAVSLAVIGIGNDLAGDDGAGIAAVARLRDTLSEYLRSRIILTTLTGDLFSVTEYLSKVKRVLFIDSIVSTDPGNLITLSAADAGTSAPSFHQTDITTVMHLLEKTGEYRPFPEWEIRGITVHPPTYLHEGLSPVVSAAVDHLVTSLHAEIRSLPGESAT